MNDFIIRLPRQKSSFNCKRLRELLDDTSAGSNDVEVDEVKIDFQKRHRTAEVTVDVTKPTSSISRLYGKKSICSSGSGAGVGNGRGAVQMYLDLGQRSFGRASNCPDCGMLFVQDDLEDRRRHAAHCRERKKGVSLPTLHGYTLLNTAAPGEVDIDDATGSSEAIIKVNRRQSLHQQQITALLQLVCAELGSDLDFVKPTDCILLYVTSQRMIVGCAVLEQVDVTRVRSISSSEDAATVMVPHYAQSQHRIEYAVRAAEGSVNDSSSETSAGARNDSFCSGVDGEAAISIASKKKYPADDLLTHSSRKNQSDKQQQQQQASSYGGVDCERQRLVTGVKIIWVAGSHRRRGIARKLLDAARRSLTFGHIIPKQQMVFSQPTADGFAFAKSYCGGRGVMAYA